jgi:hypothetical protein
MGIDVVAYLGHLLHRNNVAILPGFGAFIAAPTPTVIDHTRGILHPPSKLISFNENLKINDGYLINHIKAKHGIEHLDARLVIDNFVQSLNEILANGESVLFDKIGKLYLSPRKQIIFESDGKTNFNPATFGLPNLKYHALPREKAESKKVESEKEESKKVESGKVKSEKNPSAVRSLLAYLPRKRTSLLAAGLLAATITSVIYLYNNKKISDSEDSFVHVAENRMNVKPAKEEGIEATTIEKASPSPTINSEDLSISEKPKTQDREIKSSDIINDSGQKEAAEEFSKKKKETPIVDNGAFSQIVFVGSFSSEKNAKKMARKLTRKGFLVIREVVNGMKRVGTSVSFNDDTEKVEKINKIKRLFGQQSWEKQ